MKGLKGFKRLGTVLGRRRQSTQPLNSSTSTKTRETRDTPSSSMRRREPSPGFFPAPIQESEQDYDAPTSPPPDRTTSMNGPIGSSLSPAQTNGSMMGRLQEPLQPQVHGQTQEQSDMITSLSPQEVSVVHDYECELLLISCRTTEIYCRSLRAIDMSNRLHRTTNM